MAIAAVGVMACGRIGFDPWAGSDGSVAGLDGSLPGTDGWLEPDAGPLQPQPGGPISDETADPDCPVLAWTGSGFVVAWIDQRDGNEEVYLARLDENGAKIGADIRVTTDANRSITPTIAGTGNGFAVAWSDDRDGNTEIYMARFGADGTRIGDELRVTSAADSSSHPSLAWTGDGYGLSWQDRRDMDTEIYAARLDAAGNKLGPDLRVMNASGLSLGPEIVWSGSELVIGWRDESAGGGSQLFVARVDGAGALIGKDTQITTEARIMTFHSMVWNGAETLAVWDDFRNDDFEIYVARIDSSGNKLGDDMRITSDAGGGADPALAWNGWEAGLVWQDDREGDVTLFMTRVNAAGYSVGPEIRLSDAPEVSKCADIVSTGSQYGIAWLNVQSTGDSIYFARVVQ